MENIFNVQNERGYVEDFKNGGECRWIAMV